jgi:hypothetical protein
MCSKYRPLVMFCGSFILVIMVCLNVAEIAISQPYMNFNTNSCHNGTLLYPAFWLMWDGIIGLVQTMVIVCTAMWFAYEHDHPILGESAVSMFETLCPVTCAVILCGIFQFIWIVMGAVVLWRDNPDCQPAELSVMLWVSVMVHIGLLGLK